MNTSFNGLLEYNNKEEFDFLAITEHWQSKEQLMNYYIDGYRQITSFCREERKHGGAVIYSKNEYVCKNRLDILNYSVNGVIECCGIECYLGKDLKLIILCIYRPDTPPNADVELFFEKLADILQIIGNGKVVILGDFNIDILKENDKSSKVFITIMESFNMNILVREPTRITYHSATCLDNVCTNIEGGSVQVVQPHLSDHVGQIFSFKCSDMANVSFTKKKIRSFSQKNLSIFMKGLHDFNWSHLYEIDDTDIDEMWKFFSEVFNEMFRVSFPFVTIKTDDKSQLNGRLMSECYKNPELLDIKQKLDVLYVISQFSQEYSRYYKIIKRAYDEKLKDINILILIKKYVILIIK